MFTNVCKDIDELCDVVSSYVSFCEASIIPWKEIFFYPNNKPWVTKSVKTVINQRNICFTQGDTARYRELQKQLKKELKLAKCRYKDKVESMLRAGSSRPAWDLKVIHSLANRAQPSSHKLKSYSPFSPPGPALFHKS